MQIRKPEQPQTDQQPVDIHDTHEAVAIFEDAASLQAAVDAVLGADFDHADLTLLAGQHAVELKLGHVYAKTPVDDPSEVRSSYVPAESVGNAKGGLIGGLVYVGAMVAGGAIFASGGTLGVALAAAAAAGGAGGVVGSIRDGMSTVPRRALPFRLSSTACHRGRPWRCSSLCTILQKMYWTSTTAK